MVAPESSHNWRRQFSKKVLGTTKTTDYRMNAVTSCFTVGLKPGANGVP